MAGVDLKTVQEEVEHRTLAMTCRYAHLAPQHQLPNLHPKGPITAFRFNRL